MESLTIACTVLKRATLLDMSMNYIESLACYQEGIMLLVKAGTDINDLVLKVKLRIKIEEYIVRAEKIRIHLGKMQQKGSFHDQIKIADNATGFSFDTVFAKYLGSNVFNIEIDDAYIQSPHQCDNFMHFVEVCIKHAQSLRSIRLVTKIDDGVNGNPTEQNLRLTKIKDSARSVTNGKVNVTYEYSSVIHDREIRFDNGYVLKMGRGLDYFKQTERHAAGWIDYNFRLCKESTIDVFYNKNFDRCV